MSKTIAGHDGGVKITRFARTTPTGNTSYQVTWRKIGETEFNYICFDDEDSARAFYNIIFQSYEIA